MDQIIVCLQTTSLAQKVAQALSLPLHQARYSSFADGEINVSLEQSALYHGKTVIIFQSTGHPVNELVLGVSFLAQELKNAGAKKIILVAPYLGYSRQASSSAAQKPGHAALVAKLFESAGIDMLISVALHDERIIDYFSIPVINLQASGLITEKIQKLGLSENSCLIAPDQGAIKLVQPIASALKLGFISFAKERIADDQIKLRCQQGDCHAAVGIVIDDIIATGSTAMSICDWCRKLEYKKIIGFFLHPVFAGNAIEKIGSSCFDRIFVSNSLKLSVEAEKQSCIEQFDISPLIINAIKKMEHNG